MLPEKITVSNCNFYLYYSYIERDQISHSIDKFIVMGWETAVSKLEDEYDRISTDIDTLISFRRKHNCLLEGDPGYGPL